MRIQKKNVAQLASLSALGAGALGIATGTAEAGIVYTPLNNTVGWTSGNAGYQWTVPGSDVFALSRGGTSRKTYTRHGSMGATILKRQGYSVKLGGSMVVFRPGDAATGQKWSDLGGTVTGMRLGLRQNIFELVSSGSGPRFTYKSAHFLGTDGDFYKLFEFYSGTNQYYGWLSFYQDIGGPDVTVTGVAYQTDGTQIAAGDESSPQPPVGPSVPEPSTMAMTGLAALAGPAAAARLARFLGEPFDAVAAAAAVEPSLRRQDAAVPQAR
jgi:hypothetical protein